MVNYNRFNTTNDVAYNIMKALEYCKKNNENVLCFDEHKYFVNSKLASERYFNVSNHTNPGLKRVCFLLDGFKNFTLDGGNSNFVFEDIMMPVALHNCENVTVKNFKFEAMNTQNCQAEIINSGDDWFEMRVTAGCDCFVKDGELYAGERGGENQKLRYFIECDGATGKLVSNAADYFFEKPEFSLEFIEKSRNVILAKGCKRKIVTGNTVVFASQTRKVCSILVDESHNTAVENVTLYSGIGMGVIAQNSDTVSISDFSTKLKDNRKYSINADGTHFVHCKGKIHIKNSYFEGQLDDALNVHSIYLKVVDKTDNAVIAEYGHFETVGIDFIKSGSVVNSVDADTQLPIKQYTVTSVKHINTNYAEIAFAENIDDINVGDLLDEVSWKPDVIFENCTVKNNRARGILIASGGNTLIKNNYFSTPGAAILFQSDAKYWFESGGAGNVEITGNVFDNCKYAKWCDAIIETVPREKEEKGRYFHDKISICKNVFRNCTSKIAIINNTKEIQFIDNEFDDCVNTCIDVKHYENADVQKQL